MKTDTPKSQETSVGCPTRHLWRNALPFVGVGGALLVHWLVPFRGAPVRSNAYACFLGVVALLWLAQAVAGVWTPRGRAWLAERAPLWCALPLTFAVWQLLTSKSLLLPMPYFPGPEKVFTVFDDLREVKMLVVGTLYSFRLLAVGYLCGSLSGLLLGVWVGWSRRASYWGMPYLKYLGTIPATAWIPLALVLFPTAFGAACFIIALSSLFPMIVLTSSGIANTRFSHLEIARTLGASNWQLVWKVAFPSALPSIFVGLFISMLSAFLCLITAEMIGVEAGLGFYITWAQNFAEYYKVFAALLLIGLFCSSLISALFWFRHHVLRWQKGVIKW